MEKGGNFIVFIRVAAFVLILGACEKPDGQPEFINTNDREGIANTLDKTDTVMFEEDSEEDFDTQESKFE